MHLDTSFIVEQRITYYEQGFFWFDYRLDDGSGSIAWLSVCDDDELELAFFFPAELDVDLPPSDAIDFDGTTFRLEEHGTVDAKIDRGSGSGTRTTVKAWDFEGDDGRLLGIQLWGEGEVEIMVGNPIQPVELDLLGGAT